MSKNDVDLFSKLFHESIRSIFQSQRLAFFSSLQCSGYFGKSGGRSGLSRSPSSVGVTNKKHNMNIEAPFRSWLVSPPQKLKLHIYHSTRWENNPVKEQRCTTGYSQPASPPWGRQVCVLPSTADPQVTPPPAPSASLLRRRRLLLRCSVPAVSITAAAVVPGTLGTCLDWRAAAAAAARPRPLRGSISGGRPRRPEARAVSGDDSRDAGSGRDEAPPAGWAAAGASVLASVARAVRACSFRRNSAAEEAVI